MAKVDGGVQLLPLTGGCIVLTYNLKGVTGLKLSRKAYVESSRKSQEVERPTHREK